MHSTIARLCAGAILVAFSMGAAAAPRVTLRAAPECDRGRGACTFASWCDRKGTNAARITVDGLGPKPVTALFYSDYGPRSAKLVKDAEGTPYVLLVYSIGRGNSAAGVKYLAVLHVADQLVVLRKVQLRYPLGPFDAAEYRYAVDTPPEGGLVLRLTRHFTGKDAKWRFPPATQVVRVAPPG